MPLRPAGKGTSPRLRVTYAINPDRWLCVTVEDLIRKQPLRVTEPVVRFDLPRQAGDDGLAIADYVRPIGHAPRDTVALFVTTAGEGIREVQARREQHPVGRQPIAV